MATNGFPATKIAGVNCTSTVGKVFDADKVVRTSLNTVLPPAPVAIHVQLEGLPTQPSLAVFVKFPLVVIIGRIGVENPEPLAEQLRVTLVALLDSQLSVNGCPAINGIEE